MSEIEKISQVYGRYMADKKKNASETSKVDRDYIVEHEGVKALVENKNGYISEK